MTASGPEQAPGAPAGAPEKTPAGRGRWRAALTGLRLADWAVGVGWLLYLLFLLLPWRSVDAVDLGWGYRLPAASANGFDSGLLVGALLLLLAAAAWAWLSAPAELPPSFPRSAVTTGLAALSVLLTSIEWLTTFDAGFSLVGLLAELTCAAVLACAVLGMLAETADLPGRLAGAARWAARPAPWPRRSVPAGSRAAGPPTSGT